ncbi:MAG: molybdate ABC transporter substrate-binding protein [Massilia sp.]
MSGFVRTITALSLTLCAAYASAGEVTVSAAASLTDAFKEIAQTFEAAHPTTKISLNFGASGALLQQIAKGAPVDVFASADQETMDSAAKLALLKPGARHDFVSNTLVVVVPKASTVAIASLAHLGQASVKKVAIGAPASVPAGRYAKHALESAGLWNVVEPKMISTQNVRQSLDYVSRGEVEAGFVYATDAALFKDKVKLAYTVPLDVRITYPISLTAASTNPEEAKQFIAFVLSPAGQAILAKFGFSKP